MLALSQASGDCTLLPVPVTRLPGAAPPALGGGHASAENAGGAPAVPGRYCATQLPSTAAVLLWGVLPARPQSPMLNIVNEFSSVAALSSTPDATPEAGAAGDADVDADADADVDAVCVAVTVADADAEAAREALAVAPRLAEPVPVAFAADAEALPRRDAVPVAVAEAAGVLLQLTLSLLAGDEGVAARLAVTAAAVGEGEATQVMFPAVPSA